MTGCELCSYTSRRVTVTLLSANFYSVTRLTSTLSTTTLGRRFTMPRSGNRFLYNHTFLMPSTPAI